MSDDGFSICVVGLGYVGLPLAVALAKNFSVCGYDINKDRVEELNRGIDCTNEVEFSQLQNDKLVFTADPRVLVRSNFIIVTVPTPVTQANEPDLSMVKTAMKTVGKYLRRGSVVVLESTVYPGVTEEVCVPILERQSKLKLGLGFKVGYSPERINPGDKDHTIDKVVKVISGSDKEALERIKRVYSSITQAGVFEAPSIKVAEAAKVVENIQRDVNIALMNELKIMFDQMQIDVNEVLKIAGTKWNFLRFNPGLVGGHCVGVDPYYLVHKAKLVESHPEIILASRRVNEGMAFYHAGRIVREMIARGLKIKGAQVLILGATFKPNVKDLRNSKVNNLVRYLLDFGCRVRIHDPVVKEKREIFGVPNVDLPEKLHDNYDFVVLAVPHRDFVNSPTDYRV